MDYVAIVTALALIEFLVLGILVGRARARFGIAAPATTGRGAVTATTPCWAKTATTSWSASRGTTT